MKPTLPLLTALLLAPLVAVGSQAKSETPTTPSRANQGDDPNLKLWYGTEAKDWMQEALPIGNGYMGAMLYGGVHEERVQFNEGTVWKGLMSQNFGEWVGQFKGECAAGQGEEVKHYRRELDLNRAVHTVTYEYKGVRYLREAFASYPANVIVLRWSASKPGMFSADFVMTDAHEAKPQAVAGCITAAGNYEAAGRGGLLHTESQLRILNEGGTQRALHDGTIQLEKADRVVILLSGGTDFLQDPAKQWRGVLPHDALTRRLDAAAKRGCDALLTEHQQDYRTLFGRVSLSLDGGPATLSPDKRIDAYKTRPDMGLDELLFQYGRYLMIASSRKGGTPAHLQGRWNNSNTPPWHCDYHGDVNIEMNYWLTGPANLAECFDPFAKWIDTLRVAAGPAAKKSQARGWTASAVMTLDGICTWQRIDAIAAWLMQNEYDHYRFTGDKQYLRTMAYPAMKGVCEFWLDTLKPGPAGKLVARGGISPEHLGAGAEGVSFSQELVWEVFTDTIEASEVLHVDAGFRKELQEKRAKLFVPRIGRFGQLQEYMEDKDKKGETYRHMSHLVGLYPGRELDLGINPKLGEAARVTLATRGKKVGTGWHSAWKAALWARLKDGEQAHAALNDLFTRCHVTKCANSGGGLYGNMFAACPPFQIDANFGFSAAVCEMLLQSHLDKIELLPALPACWKNGKVRGMVARGAIEVDMEWENGKVRTFTLHSAAPKPVKVHVNGEIKTITPEKLNP